MLYHNHFKLHYKIADVKRVKFSTSLKCSQFTENSSYVLLRNEFVALKYFDRMLILKRIL